MYTYDRATGAISADQETFVDKLLDQYAMSACNPCLLPMAVGADLASIPLPDVSDKDIVAVYVKLVGECSTSASTRCPISCALLTH